MSAEADWERWYNGDPECWSWPAPLPGQTVDDWFSDFCALCGNKSDTVDHCHATGLVRGNLCHSCNRREGRHGGGIYQRYRERPPAVIVWHARRYDDTNWSTGEAEQWVVERFGDVPTDPADAAAYLALVAALACEVRRADRKRDNPLKQMGL